MSGLDSTKLRTTVDKFVQGPHTALSSPFRIRYALHAVG